MAISGIKNTFIKQWQKASNCAQQAFYDVMPNCLAGEKADKFYKTAGREISSAENRLILGATALMTQPFIDAHNRNIDEDTRRVAVCRTIAKIIAGTLTGYAVRKGTIHLIKQASHLPEPNVPKWKSFLTPKSVKDVNTEEFKQYQNAIGTFTALGVMLFTNFLIDAPLTRFLTNKFNAKAKEKQAQNTPLAQGTGGVK